MISKKNRALLILRTTDVKKYVIKHFHSIPKKKFEIVKVSTRSYIYLVNQSGNLVREHIFSGNLKMVNEQEYLKIYLHNNIKKALKKHGYL